MNLISWVWNIVMDGLQCCGLEAYIDFTNNTQWQRGKLSMQILPSDCLTLEIVVIILAVCLCMLQKTRTDKTSRHRTVIVREKDRGWDRRGRSGAGHSGQFQP